MTAPTPTATVSDLDAELGADASELADSRKQTYLQRAARIIADRAPPETVDDSDLLGDLEALAAAHLAFSRLSGAESGDVVSKIDQDSASISYDTEFISVDGPGGYPSPYWATALTLEPQLQTNSSGGDGWVSAI